MTAPNLPTQPMDTVRDRTHLADVLRSLKRTPSVLKAQRVRPKS